MADVQWAQTSDQSLTKEWFGNEYHFNNDGAAVNCPTAVDGIDPTGIALVPSINGSNGSINGYACENTAPMLDVGSNSNGNAWTNEKFYIKFPSLKQEVEAELGDYGEVVQCPT
jgi:hypothetical protein